MQIAAIQRLLGLLLMAFSLSMLPPAVVGWIYGDGAIRPFLLAFALTVATGLVIWLPVRRRRGELRLRDGFVVVAMFWAVLGVFAALPLMLAPHPHMTLTNAVFEAISGLTTTGATVLTGLDRLPHAILYYRQQLQWLGGMGIVVLAVAIVPMLGIGGMQLYRAETPGPMKETKLTPRLAETARALWLVYLVLTAACALAYWAAGMNGFDAIGHSFSTVSIGGFSTHDANMGFYTGKPLIDLVAIVFLLASGVNFSLHFLAWRTRRIRHYFADPELRTYLAIIATLAVITVAYLYAKGVFDRPGDTLIEDIFQTVSIATTAGFTTHAYHGWPTFLPVMLLFATFIGGCAGSTAGGIKVIRFLLLLKQGRREVMRVIHPNAIFPLKIGRKVLPNSVVDSVWGFFAAYVAVFTLIMLALILTGENDVTAFSAVAACMNNLGPGLGMVAKTYADVGTTAKWILAVAMVIGRLEVFTLLVVLSPTFWRR